MCQNFYHIVNFLFAIAGCVFHEFAKLQITLLHLKFQIANNTQNRLPVYAGDIKSVDLVGKRACFIDLNKSGQSIGLQNS